MDPIDHLSHLLNELPGIGPRQAKRLAYFLILKSQEFNEELSDTIREVKLGISNCTSCCRYISKKNLVSGLCSICRDQTRDRSLLMIVSRDVDLQSMERSGLFKGYYFVLGGSVPVLDKAPQDSIRLKELISKIDKEKENLKEIILAHNQNPEGEHTARVISEALDDLKAAAQFKISHLGRGLSTGTELEYSDNETLRNALKNRG